MERSTTLIKRANQAVKALSEAKTLDDLMTTDARCLQLKAELKAVYDKSTGPCAAWEAAKKIEHARLERAEAFPVPSGAQ